VRGRKANGRRRGKQEAGPAPPVPRPTHHGVGAGAGAEAAAAPRRAEVAWEAAAVTQP
jgi:hypothetical protein